MTAAVNKRTREQMEVLAACVVCVLEADHPMTLWQVFYRLVSLGVIAKAEAEYGAVGRLLCRLRRQGQVPFDWVVDNTRRIQKPASFSSLNEALASAAQNYRRSVWDDEFVQVQIWLEKDALAGVVGIETASWDVPLLVTRGYPSLTFLHEAAETIRSGVKEALLYYFGDHDPSGVDIPRKINEDLRCLAPDADFSLVRVAVLPAQIKAWNLPTRPTKRSDTRSKTFIGESVELDAIQPRQLRLLARSCIEHHIDADTLSVLKVKEQEERSILEKLAKRQWPTGNDGPYQLPLGSE